MNYVMPLVVGGAALAAQQLRHTTETRTDPDRYRLQTSSASRAVLGQNPQAVDSQSITIPLATPSGAITDIQAPTSALEGQTVTITATARNDMNVTAFFRFRLFDSASGDEITPDTGGQSLNIVSGGTTQEDITLTMPSNDLSIDVELWFLSLA